MNVTNWILSLTVIIAGSLASGSAHAGDEALAEALFRKGRQLMVASDFDGACPKLQESQRLDPQLGTLLNLAVCRQKQGRTATAWALFSEAVTLAEQGQRPGRVTFAKQQLAALEPKLSRVTIVVDAAAGVSVSMDGRELRAGALNAPLPLDPGEHTLSASAEGMHTFSKTFAVPQGPASIEVRVPALEPKPEQAPVEPPAAEPEAEAPAAQPPPAGDADDGEEGGSAMLPVGIAATAIGGAAIVVGAIFGARAMSQQDDAEASCPGPDSCPTSEGVALYDDALTSSHVSTAMFVVGGVLAATGVTLMLLAPSDEEGVATALRVGPAALSLSGAF